MHAIPLKGNRGAGVWENIENGQCDIQQTVTHASCVFLAAEGYAAFQEDSSGSLALGLRV